MGHLFMPHSNPLRDSRFSSCGDIACLTWYAQPFTFRAQRQLAPGGPGIPQRAFVLELRLSYPCLPKCSGPPPQLACLGHCSGGVHRAADVCFSLLQPPWPRKVLTGVLITSRAGEASGIALATYSDRRVSAWEFVSFQRVQLYSPSIY